MAKYEVNIDKSILNQKLDLVKEMNHDLFLISQYEIRKELMDLDPSKLWCKYTVRYIDYQSADMIPYLIETIGFIQAIYFSTGKARIADPIGFFGSSDITDFEIINPQNLSLVLEKD